MTIVKNIAPDEIKTSTSYTLSFIQHEPFDWNTSDLILQMIVNEKSILLKNTQFNREKNGTYSIPSHGTLSITFQESEIYENVYA